MLFDFIQSHKFIIVWLSLAAFLHNILMNGANNVIISSLQKEFYLSSRETGVYVSVYDIGSLLSSIFISFAAARGSKPRWIAFGMIMLFVGCMVNVLPHFLKPSQVASGALAESKLDFFNASHVVKSDSIIELCNSSLSVDENMLYARNVTRVPTKLITNEPKTPASTGFQFQLKHLLYAANIINGLSSASMTSITFSYIEDIAPSHKLSSIYEAIYFVFGAFGVS
jgi:MFS family permease